jgi:hypothetical protein
MAASRSGVTHLLLRILGHHGRRPPDLLGVHCYPGGVTGYLGHFDDDRAVGAGYSATR